MGRILWIIFAVQTGSCVFDLHLFERILRVDLGRLSNNTVSTFSHVTFPGCLHKCLSYSTCQSSLYMDNNCHILNWYLEFSDTYPINSSILYFGRKLNAAIATLKPTNASSVFNDNWGKVSEPVNGVGLDSEGQCLGVLHTETGDLAPWWRVDLADVYDIVQIVWIGKQEPDKMYRQSDIEIVVGANIEAMNQRCAYFIGPAKIGFWNVENCPPMTTGQYVQFQKPVVKTANEMVLELCEVVAKVIL